MSRLQTFDGRTDSQRHIKDVAQRRRCHCKGQRRRRKAFKSAVGKFLIKRVKHKSREKRQRGQNKIIPHDFAELVRAPEKEIHEQFKNHISVRDDEKRLELFVEQRADKHDKRGNRRNRRRQRGKKIVSRAEQHDGVRD